MTYPQNYEQKIGFNEIRQLLRANCMSTLGKEKVDKIEFSTDATAINRQMQEIREFRRLQSEDDSFPLHNFFDVRESVARLRLEGTYIDEDEMWDLNRSLRTIIDIVRYLNRTGDEDGNEGDEEDGRAVTYPYPALHALTEDIMTFPNIAQRIEQILDKWGKMRDDASPTLHDIRRQLASTEGSISRTLYNILRSAQSEGLVEKDVTPTLRDGRLVIPVAPGMKRKIKGIVHDESASGKTVFIEPTEVVEANNRIRELEADERREVIRILKDFANMVRPNIKEIVDSYRLLANIDLIRSKALLAETTSATEPRVEDKPHIDWIQAKHPLLALQLAKQQKKIVPLDITLTNDKRILVISGPNAGGKSVCLKTVGLLQYMLQCGLPIPVSERSKTGIFENIMIDIGDEQSIADDLSTYSGHLTNMKNMIRQSNDHTLLLIDEFGTGTEPQIGGAIAESVLKQFCKREAYGVITTHYQNLKYFADNNPGVANGAMLYDRHEMKALFQLAIGQPGSSFAIEIARKTGLPEEVIKDASEIVGSEYIQSDKYLQDIVRDKRYWENKRQNVHQQEKQLKQKIDKYDSELTEIAKLRNEVLRKAKEQAEELLRESNKKIENTIREIKEAQAHKEETKRIREELNAFKQVVDEIDATDNDEMIARKMRQIQERKERKEKRKKEKQENQTAGNGNQPTTRQEEKGGKNAPALKVGDTVRIKGLKSVGVIESIDGKNSTVIFGDMRTKMRTDRLERAEKPKKDDAPSAYTAASRMTRDTIDSRKLNFKQDIDVRGMRANEALNAVMYFIDDAILVGMPRVRILHGTGTGALRITIREYLSTVPNVTGFRDEHVQFGGAGITVVDLG